MTNAVASQPGIGIIPWWAILLEGIAALFIGLLFLTSPVATLIATIQFLGAYWFVIGILSIVGIFIDKANWGWKLIGGIFGILAGLAVMGYPILSTMVLEGTLILYIAILGIFTGLISLYNAYSGHSWENALIGIIGILFGLFIIANPLSAVIALSHLLGIIGIIGGIIAIAGAIKLRSVHRR